MGAVKTVEEALELMKVGFEYATKIEVFKLFRKHKQRALYRLTVPTKSEIYV